MNFQGCLDTQLNQTRVNFLAHPKVSYFFGEGYIVFRLEYNSSGREKYWYCFSGTAFQVLLFKVLLFRYCFSGIAFQELLFRNCFSGIAFQELLPLATPVLQVH